MDKDIEAALDVLLKGGIILYPTDTIWGIGCDATNERAVERIYKIKKRVDKEGMLVLLDSPARLAQYVEIPDVAWELVDVAEKPLTIIYPGAKNLAANLMAGDSSVGIRIVKDNFCIKLIQKFKRPVVSTSANISGARSPQVFSEIHKDIIDSVDYVVKWRQDDLTRINPSGIIKLRLNGEVKVIRE
ncbi:MAG: threonylcarbamoyl-AMP synthase [Bacteroidales bacterium]|nr:MAG: threonylcarbamoyl-AMP synthase [Bacteroidales bacterium]